MTDRSLPSHEQCLDRLAKLFPREAFDTVLSNELAAQGLRAMLYVGAVVPDAGRFNVAEVNWVRPTMVLWLTDAAYMHSDSDARQDYWKAASRSKNKVRDLHDDWGEDFTPRYADNTREGLRDETFPEWLEQGVMRSRPGVDTTSSRPRWAIVESFADLFDPDLPDELVEEKIADWRDNHMSPSGRLKALMAQQRSNQEHEVVVKLPSPGGVRNLNPGESSVIVKGVIEEWAPRRLSDPVVLAISQSGEKLYLADAKMLQSVGISIEVNTLLPDALIADMGREPVEFWIVEAVATDGVIGDDRRRALLRWAAAQRIPLESCRFLTAFGSRNAQPAKRRLKDLAVGTFAWYVDEPERELAWYELGAES